MGATKAETFKAFESKGWSVQAETYGGLIGAITSRLVEPLLDAAGVGADKRVLDVATGPGYVAQGAAARGARPVGLDLRGDVGAGAAPGRRDRVRARGRRAAPFRGHLLRRGRRRLRDQSPPRPERAVQEAARVLAPGGAVAFSVWDRPERMRVMGVVTDAIHAAGVERGDATRAGGPDPYRFADGGEFSALLEGAGLTAVAVATVELTHRVAGTEALWRGILGSSVRTVALLRAQGAATRRRIREALKHAVEPYRGSDGALELPVAARLGSGRKR